MLQVRGSVNMSPMRCQMLRPRTLSTMLYFLLMLPLGILYFTLAPTLLLVGITFVRAPIASWTGLGDAWLGANDLGLVGIGNVPIEGWGLVPMLLAGVLLLFATLHVARAIGRGHGLLAKHLLVKTAQYS